MKHTTAKKLLDRYFLGETTLEEEQQLRAYFRSGDIHPDLALYPPLFTYWDEAAEIMAPVRIRPVHRRRPLRWLSVAAAAAALILGLNTWFGPTTVITGTGFPIAAAQAEPAPIDWSKYEVTDPEEAYKVLREALGAASASLNKGTSFAVREMVEVRQALK